jgi:hypothetical protein
MEEQTMQNEDYGHFDQPRGTEDIGKRPVNPIFTAWKNPGMIGPRMEDKSCQVMRFELLE